MSYICAYLAVVESPWSSIGPSIFKYALAPSALWNASSMKCIYLIVCWSFSLISPCLHTYIKVKVTGVLNWWAPWLFSSFSYICTLQWNMRYYCWDFFPLQKIVLQVYRILKIEIDEGANCQLLYFFYMV